MPRGRLVQLSVHYTPFGPRRVGDLQAMDEAPKGTEIPASALSKEALRSIVEDFVTRDGTDYGARERSLEEKVAAVERQIERGDVVIVFDPESESLNLIRSEDR